MSGPTLDAALAEVRAGADAMKRAAMAREQADRRVGRAAAAIGVVLNALLLALLVAMLAFAIRQDRRQHATHRAELRSFALSDSVLHVRLAEARAALEYETLRAERERATPCPKCEE